LDVRSGHIAAQWAGEPGGIPGEPLFVGRPGGADEDDGVVLAHLTTAGGESVLLVLDGASLTEMARVGLPAPVAYGFHGCWLPAE
jgi:carlactone synthase/all-trans-10'-apo-beta-carotenal 13,14-cleaving dioxygenase